MLCIFYQSITFFQSLPPSRGPHWSLAREAHAQSHSGDVLCMKRNRNHKDVHLREKQETKITNNLPDTQLLYLLHAWPRSLPQGSCWLFCTTKCFLFFFLFSGSCFYPKLSWLPCSKGSHWFWIDLTNLAYIYNHHEASAIVIATHITAILKYNEIIAIFFPKDMLYKFETLASIKLLKRKKTYILCKFHYKKTVDPF